MTNIAAAASQLPYSAGTVHIVLALGGFAIGTTEFATMSLLPAFSEGLGVDAPTGGHAISAYALGVVVGAPLFAVFGAKLNRRTLLMLLMTWFAVGNGLSALAPTFGSLLTLRFLTGLPHGAYFGVAAWVAAGLVPAAERTIAIGRVMTGLTSATLVGVPLANALGQWLGWRWGFGVVAALAALTLTLIFLVVAGGRPEKEASFRRELGALRNAQVWLTLAIGAIGFGGMFAVYTYLASTLAEVTHAPSYAVAFVLAAFGVGMTAGNLIVPRFADRALMPVAGGLLVWSAVALAIYPFASLVDHACRRGDRRRRCARLGAPDPTDGCRRRRAGSRSRAQPFGIQHRQRAWSLARRPCDRIGLWLDLDRLGRLRPCVLRSGHLGRGIADRAPKRLKTLSDHPERTTTCALSSIFTIRCAAGAMPQRLRLPGFAPTTCR